MKNTAKKLCLCLLACVLTFFSVQTATVKACQVPPSEWTFTPSVLTNEITNRTTGIPVYVYEDTTLYIKNGSKIIYQKFYSKEGLKNVKIKKQKGGSKLKFYLISKDSGKKGDVVTRKVVKLPTVAPEKPDSTIPKPVVSKSITSKTTSIKVTGNKGTTLVVKNEKKTLKTVKFKKDGEKKITIPVQEKGTLYFYLKKGNKRSEVVSRTVKDVTAPEAPKLRFSDGGSALYVKGEIGAKVYFKGENGWSYERLIISNKWHEIELWHYGYCEYYKVYLKDAAGNKSETVRVRNPNSDEVPMPIS